MKKYHLFAGSHFYPGGGICDYIGSFETEEQALSEEIGYNHDWIQIGVSDSDGSLTPLYRMDVKSKKKFLI